jgi:putative aldouronate transport system substrate-binding protein
MSQWADKGYWSKDILSAQVGAKTNFNNGVSGGFLTHMADWTGNYGALKTSQPNLTTSFWTFAESKGKILRKAGVENSTAINKNSKNPEKALMAIEKLITDESYYDLLQYGIKGKQYEVQDGKVTKPASFNKDVDAGGFSGWAFRNDKFNIPYASEDPRRYELNKQWDKTAINNPYLGFNFDSSKVSSELSSISNVNSTLGAQIMLGKAKGDPKAAVQQYRATLKTAGIDKVIDEVKRQLSSFTPAK